MSGKNKILRDRNGFDTTEEIPRGRFADIMPLSQRAYLEISGSERKDGIFELADEVAMLVYQITAEFPKEELFGLTSQIRRAAV